MSKWGCDRELTQWHRKAGKGSRTPWDLLNESCQGNSKSRMLWLEFAEAFKGLAQLYWSPGLKARFGIEDLSDSDIAEALQEKMRQVGELPDGALVVLGRGDRRASFLHRCDTGGFPAALDWLVALMASDASAYNTSNISRLNRTG